jgi:phage gp46-like protein
MTDIEYKLRPDGVYDIAMDGPDLKMEAGIETASLISLFSDRRASLDDELPWDTDDLRGWWGDCASEDKNELRLGSKLWLLYRSKNIQQTIAAAADYVQEALQWLLDEGVATRIEKTVEAVTREILGIDIVIYRRDGKREASSYEYQWSG